MASHLARFLASSSQKRRRTIPAVASSAFLSCSKLFSSLSPENPTALHNYRLVPAWCTILTPRRLALPSTRASIPFAARRPLFLSAPSSRLSQPTPSIYCPTNVKLELLWRNALIRVLRSRPMDDSLQRNRLESARCDASTVIHRHHVDVKKTVSVLNLDSFGNREVFNWPNAISFGRLLSGPFIAWLIVQGLPKPAIVGLVIAGASDWLDGYVARNTRVDSTVGTYLDPLADKILIGCVAVSMVHVGYLPSELVILILTRDVVLIGGSLIQRAHGMNWQLNRFHEFFNVYDGVPKVKPLFISKINTVFQLALVGTALIQHAFSIEDTYSLVPFLSWCVAFTTCASTIGYGWIIFAHK